MKHLFSLIFVFTICTSFFSCSKEEGFKYKVSGDSQPGKIENVVVENIAGGSIIKFEKPKDFDLQMIEAHYMYAGKKITQRVSSFADSLIIKGLNTEKEIKVSLVAQNKNGMSSDSVSITISPLKPNVFKILSTIRINDDFGGVRVEWENPAAEDVVLHVIQELGDSDDYTEVDRFYSHSKEKTVNVRGFKDSSVLFGFYFTDRWNNTTDTIFSENHPFPEDQLDKGLFQRWNPPGIPYNAYTNDIGMIEQLWDGTETNQGRIFADFGHDITFDMGQTALLSRVKIHGRPTENLVYNFAHPKKFQLWGSSTSNVNQDFSKWIFLGEFESIKPSGLPLGEFSDEDYNYSVIEGEEWNFPPDLPPVRYIRWVVKDTWGESTYTQVAEMTFWGNIVE